MPPTSGGGGIHLEGREYEGKALLPNSPSEVLHWTCYMSECMFCEVLNYMRVTLAPPADDVALQITANPCRIMSTPVP